MLQVRVLSLRPTKRPYRESRADILKSVRQVKRRSFLFAFGRKPAASLSSPSGCRRQFRAGSSPVTRTRILTKSRGFISTFGRFLLLFGCLVPTFSKTRKFLTTVLPRILSPQNPFSLPTAEQVLTREKIPPYIDLNEKFQYNIY